MFQREHGIAVALMHWWAFEAKLHALDERLLFAIPNGGFRHPVVAAKLKAEGVRPGVSDYFLAVPNKTYNGLFLELKAEKGRVSPLQKAFAEAVTRTGYLHVVARGMDEATKAIDSYLLNSGEDRVGGTDGE